MVEPPVTYVVSGAEYDDDIELPPPVIGPDPPGWDEPAVGEAGAGLADPAPAENCTVLVWPSLAITRPVGDKLIVCPSTVAGGPPTEIVMPLTTAVLLPLGSNAVYVCPLAWNTAMVDEPPACVFDAGAVVAAPGLVTVALTAAKDAVCV